MLRELRETARRLRFKADEKISYLSARRDMQTLWLEMQGNDRYVQSVPGDGDCLFSSLAKLFSADVFTIRAFLLGVARVHAATDIGGASILRTPSARMFGILTFARRHADVFSFPVR